MFFDGWQSAVRTLIVGVLAYVSLVVLIRGSGKRTLSQFNAYDYIITVALGSTLSSLLISRDVALVQGIVALATLIGLQFIITWASTRWHAVEKLVKNEPVMLVHNGKHLQQAMNRERITMADLREAFRLQNIDSLEQVDAVVLETNGRLSILKRVKANASALTDVRAQ